MADENNFNNPVLMMQRLHLILSYAVRGMGAAQEEEYSNGFWDAIKGRPRNRHNDNFSYEDGYTEGRKYRNAGYYFYEVSDEQLEQNEPLNPFYNPTLQRKHGGLLHQFQKAPRRTF
jgi:hypothetical protein